MNALVEFQGKVQEEGRDFCRGTGERRRQRDEGARKNPSGLSLPRFSLKE